MSRFELDIDSSEVQRLIDGAQSTELERDDYQDLADFAAMLVIERNQAGLDANERTFRYYSNTYARYRAKKGRVVDRVNLEFTGKMHAAIVGRGMPAMAVVGYMTADAERIGGYHNEGRGVPKREFMAFYRRTRSFNRLAKRAADLYAKKLNE